MKLTATKEIISICIIMILGFALLNPFHILMPSMLEMTLYAVLLVLAAIFAGFVANEKAEDEREEKHRASAGRAGYLLGLCVLIIGISVQTFSHQTVDSWLTTALLAMVLGKIFSRIYTRTFE